MNNEYQLRLWQLISPALPIGSFAYSQGLEYAVEAGWVSDEQQTANWIKGLIKHSLSQLDIPVMQRFYAAWQHKDIDQAIYWNQWLLAARESKEIRDEDVQLGQALYRVLNGLEIDLPSKDEIDWSYAAMFAFAAVEWQIPFDEAARGLLWAWAENQVAAAIKIVPLGQTAGQRALSLALKEISHSVRVAMECNDEDIGVLAPGLAIASALHETQYSRLFRS